MEYVRSVVPNILKRVSLDIAVDGAMLSNAAIRTASIVKVFSIVGGIIGTGGVLAGAGYGYYQLTNLLLKD